MKRILSLILACAMVIGILPAIALTAGAEDTEELTPVVYSFIAEAVAGNTAASNVDMRLMKSYTQLDSSVSTGAWMYSGICHRMDGYTMYADKDGGATFRAAKTNLGNNAFILKAKVEKAGTYTPSMVYAKYAQYGRLNVYFVPVSYADSKWTMSATDLNLSEVFADSGVKLVVSQDGWVSSGSSSNVVGEYDNVYLDSGEYYVLVSLFEGSGTSTHASNAYFKTKGLTLTPYVAPDASAPVVFSFNAEAKSGYTSGNVDMTTITSYAALDKKVSTGAWMYYSKIGMDAQVMYAEKDGGTTFRAVTSTLESDTNNAIILKAKIENSGTYTPSMSYVTYQQYGKLNIYFVPVAYADSKWTMNSSSLDLASVYSDPQSKLIISQDAWVKSGSSSLVGEYDNVYLDSGEYYVVISFVKGSGASTHSWATYFKTKGITLTPYVAPPELTKIEADFGEVRVGNKISPEIKWFVNDVESDGTNGTSTVEIIDNEDGALIETQSGEIYAIAEASATLKVSGTLNGITKSVEVTVNVMPSAPLSGINQDYYFYSGMYEDYTQGLTISGAKKGTPVTEAQFEGYTMRDYGTDRPWGMVAARLTRPDSTGTYLGTSANWTDLSGYNGDWVAYKVKVPAAGTYNVDVRGREYTSAGRAEIYMLPYTSDMTFASITSNIGSYCAPKNLVADADLYGTSGGVAWRAFSGQFTASDALDYSKGYAEYLMIVKGCYSRKSPGQEYILLRSIHLVGTPREIEVTTSVTENEIGVGEAVTVKSVTGRLTDGGIVDFAGADFLYEIAEDDKNILKYDSKTGEIVALSEGVGTLKTCVILNGAVSHSETEITVDNNYKIIKTYLYTNNRVMIGEELLFTTGYELANRKALPGGIIESLEVINESEEGVAAVTESGKTVRATGAGTFEVKAKINIRGNIIESVPEKILVYSEDVAPSSVVEINFKKGVYPADNYDKVNDIKAYTDFRPWIFHSAVNLDSRYPDIMLNGTGTAAQIVWQGGANLYNSYVAFKVKFPKTSMYLAEGDMFRCRWRNAALDLYVMPATEEFESNILKYAVPTSEYYVGTADFYSAVENSDGCIKPFGIKEITEGEHLVVYRVSETGAGGAGGDAAYVNSFTFSDENALGSAEVIFDGGSNVIPLGESVNTSLRLKTVKGENIDYAEGDITAVVYKSEDTDIATIDENGVITGINEGEVKLSATVTYDGITKKAECVVYVSDNSGIVDNGIRITVPGSVYVYGAAKLGATAEMNSGNILSIPDKYISWEILEGAEYVELSEGGSIYGLAMGKALISASVSSDYKNGAAEGIVIEPIEVEVGWDATIDPQIYTLEERENAKINASKYAWARNEVKTVKANADRYVENLDKLYELIASEGLPRYYHIGHKYDPTKNFCRFCKADIGTKYNSVFPTNAINNPWKVQCPECKRQFPSNDFGSFYKLGLADDGTFSIDRALQNHHEKFVCEDIKAGSSCSHIGKFPSYPTETPGTAEWTEKLAAWNNARESQEWKDHYGYNVNGGYLTNNLYPDIDKQLGITGWGVDDGIGYKMPYISLEKAKEIVGEDGDVTTVPGYDPSYYDNGNGYAWYMNGATKGPVQYTFISYFLHNGVWYAGEQVVREAINSLATAFVYTGEAKYGRAGAILLDRVADFFPGYDWFRWHTWRGDDYYGTIVDAIWTTFMTYDLALAYDAFKPIYNDPYVTTYLSAKAPQYETDELGNWIYDNNGELIPINLKDTPGALMKNIEDNLLLEMFERTKYGEHWGNFGMHQKSLAAAAVALNRMPESGEIIDWIFAPGPVAGTSSINSGKVPRTVPVSGGMFLGSLIGDIDRDGSGKENAPGYNREWITHFLGVAELLCGFELYPQADLYDNAKFTKMFDAQIRLLLGGYYTTHTGDSGAIGGTGIAVMEDDILLAYKETKKPILAQALWFLKETRGFEIRGSILDEDPEQITKDVEAVIENYGKLSLPSDMLAGYGFAALRAGGEYESASETSYNNTHRDFAIYFGKSDMHGHRDTLNLFADAFGLNIAPDIGYPEETGQQPNRYQWVSTTISHNTVVVDEKEQEVIKTTQTPIHFDDSGKVKLMDISADVYSDTEEYRRSVVMVEVDDEISYGIDFFHIKGGNDHLYSFHSQSDEHEAIAGLGDIKETPMYTDDAGNTYGTYAGPDVKYGPDPGGVSSEIYPKGYTWLREVRTYQSIDKDFTVEFNVKDWKKVMDKKRDVRLRVTMLNDSPVSEVTFAKALPPQNKSNAHAGNLEYMLVRRKGTNLDTVFTTVFEPYDVTNKYIKSIEKASMVREESSKPGVLDAYSAVKVTLESGRVDYIIYSTNNAADYVIDDKIAFRGFAGVVSFDAEGNIMYSYLNDGEVLKLVDAESEESIAAYTGTVQSFTEELSKQNYIVYKPDMETDVDALAGKYVYVDNDGVQNGAYRIESASLEDGNVKLDIGDVSVIRSYVNANDTKQGYVYNVAKGNSLKIPMPSVTNNAPVFKEINDVTASVGSLITIPIEAVSPVGKKLELVGTSLPRGMAISEDGLSLVWKPDKSQIGENHVAISANDGALETTVHFTVDVYGSTTGGTTTPTQPETPNTPKEPSTPSGGTGGGGTGGGGTGGGGVGTSTAPSEPSKPEVETPDVPETTGGFVDLGAHAWASDAINALAEEGIIKGTSETTFSPANNITRADFAILLVRAFELSSDNTENFADVDASDYFAKELAIARNTGIVNGIGDNKYAPKNTITRQDMMVIVYRAMQKLGVELENGDVEYADFSDVSDYAKEAVSALITAGLVNGKNGKIAPADYTTRAEVAVLIKRILDYIAK